MPTPAFTPRDRSRVKYHLGYLAVAPAASIQFGIPRPIETLFLVEDALNNIIDDGFNVQNVLRILGILDGVECRLVAFQDYLAANQLGNLTVNPDKMDNLEQEYIRWQGRLGDILGVPIYPYTRRAMAGAGIYGNVRVRR